MEDCGGNYSKPPSCFNYSNTTALSVLQATIPNCQSGHWQPLTPAWKGLFYTHLIVFGSFFLLFAIGCLICLYKHHTITRLRKMKTLIAVDVALIILGFSKIAFYVLDPYGISGYCDAFACVVVSRVLSALTFPSLTASYTLVFATLWHVSTAKLGRNKVQRWKIVVPLCFVHYFVAVIVELISAFSAYPAIFLLLACQFVFTVWGLLVCSTFLIVGLRILKSVKSTARKSAIVRRDATLNRILPLQTGQSCLSRIDMRTFDAAVLDAGDDTSNDGVDGAIPVVESSTRSISRFNESPVDQPVTGLAVSPESGTSLTRSNDTTSPSVNGKSSVLSAPELSELKSFISKRHMQAIQKVSIITYAVAVLGALYSVMGLIMLALLVMTLFGPCPEDESLTGKSPYIWLTFAYILSAFELLLASLLLYSVNKVQPLVNLMKGICCSILQCWNVSTS